MKKLHSLAEHADWNNWPPKRFWAALLRYCDRKAGFLYLGKPRPEPTSKQYAELLYAVEHKFENESRHETALRYIRERESHDQGGEGEQESKIAKLNPHFDVSLVNEAIRKSGGI